MERSKTISARGYARHPSAAGFETLQGVGIASAADRHLLTALIFLAVCLVLLPNQRTSSLAWASEMVSPSLARKKAAMSPGETPLACSSSFCPSSAAYGPALLHARLLTTEAKFVQRCRSGRMDLSSTRGGVETREQLCRHRSGAESRVASRKRMPIHSHRRLSYLLAQLHMLRLLRRSTQHLDAFLSSTQRGRDVMSSESREREKERERGRWVRSRAGATNGLGRKQRSRNRKFPAQNDECAPCSLLGKEERQAEITGGGEVGHSSLSNSFADENSEVR